MPHVITELAKEFLDNSTKGHLKGYLMYEFIPFLRFLSHSHMSHFPNIITCVFS